LKETKNFRLSNRSKSGILSLGLLTSLLYCGPIFAISIKQSLVNAFKHFKSGTYIHALEDLESIKTNSDPKILGNKEYLKGIIYNRLLRYEEAIDSFQKALKLGFKIDDFYYELGQAYYANNDLFKSRKAFSLSHKQGFNKKVSLYYMAHISQIIEEYKKAKEYYIELLKITDSDKDTKMTQIAEFQLGECLLSMAEKREDPEDLVEKYVIPQMSKAVKTARKTPLAKEIQTRITEIKRRYFLDPNLMKNGRNLSNKRLQLRFRHKISYDSNITLATDIPSAQTLQKETFIHEDNLNLGYQFSHSGRFIHTPSIRLRNTYNTDRQTPTVYQNDTMNITGNLNNSYEHTFLGKQASALFNISHTYIGRDHFQIKHKSYFSRATAVYIGEKFNFFNSGPTTIKLKYKDYKAYDHTLNNKTKSISLQQIKAMANNHMLLILAQYDDIYRYNLPYKSTASYLLRFDYLTPNIWNGFTLNTSLSTMFLDTKQQTNRGLEKTITPSIELRRKVGKYLNTTLGFDFTRNISKDKQNYDYTKHIIRFQIGARY